MTSIEHLLTAANLNDPEERAMLADELKAQTREAEAELLLGPGGVVIESGKLVRAYRGRFGGCPSFFRACCREAAQGGQASYGAAGQTLARHLGRLLPDELDTDAWQAELDWLDELLGADEPDHEGILGWFDFHYPRCMQRVPKRRRRGFAQGVLEASQNEEIALDAW
jgi:hypothetical protein